MNPFDVRTTAAYVHVSHEVLADSPPSIEALMFEAFDRHYNPWRYPDPPVAWALDLFPRWTRFVRWLSPSTQAVQ